jgi:hypothetical protein
MAKTSYIPKGYHNVTPSLSFKGTDAALFGIKMSLVQKKK